MLIQNSNHRSCGIRPICTIPCNSRSPACVCTYPWAKSNELEYTLNGEEEGEGEVHVGENVDQHERRAVKLVVGPDSQISIYAHIHVVFMYIMYGGKIWFITVAPDKAYVHISAFFPMSFGKIFATIFPWYRNIWIEISIEQFNQSIKSDIKVIELSINQNELNALTLVLNFKQTNNPKMS